MGDGPSLLQLMLGRLKSPTSTTGEDLGVVAREFLKYVRDLQLDPGGL